MNLFLLAAGEGTRFRPHTERLPKPAIPFCGAPLLYYSYYFAKCLNPNRLVINTFHLPNEIHKVGRTLSKFGVEVEFSDEQPQLLGSAGGMAKAQNLLKGQGDFIALNADEVIIPKNPLAMRAFYEAGEATDSLATLMVMRHPEAGKKFGAVWVTSQGKVLGFGKVRPDSKEELIPYHFIGPMYFKERIFNCLKPEPSNILHDTLKAAMAEGERVDVFPIDCEWFETGNLEDYLQATKAVIDLLEGGNLFLQQMQSDLDLQMELEQRDGAKVLKHRESKIESEAKVQGFAVLGAQAHLLKTASVRNSVLGDGVVLSKECQNALVLGEALP